MGDQRKPDYEIQDDGQKVKDDVKSCLVQISVDERTDQAAICTIELRDEGGRMSDGTRFKIGSSLTVALGYVGATKPVFDGEVVGWRGAFPRRGPSTLVVVGMDRFHRLRRTRKSRSFLKMKDSDIVQQIAGDYGFSLDAKATPTKHDYVIQANQSDADFLLARAAVHGYEAFVDGARKLVFRAPNLDGAPVAKLKWHETLKHFAPTMSVADVPASLTASSYDVKTKKPVSKKVEAGNVSKMGSTTLGVEVTKKVSPDGIQFPKMPILDPQETESLAKAMLDERARRFVMGEGVAQGNPDIRRASVIEVDGIGEILSGNYYVQTAVHLLQAGKGYSTTFRVQRTAVGKPAAAPPRQAPAATPRQAPAPTSKPGNCEFVVKNQFGDPVDGLDYVLTAPDGTQTTGKVPASGVVNVPQPAQGGTYVFALKGVDPPQVTVE